MGSDRDHSIAALHQAARWYCLDRVRYWQHLPKHLFSDLAPPWPWETLEFLLCQVEQFVPTDFATVDELREMLILVTGIPGKAVLESTPDSQELVLFKQFLLNSDSAQWSHVPQLPYRRVLTDAETVRLRQSLEARWGRWYGGYCDRLTSPVATLDLAILEMPGSCDYLRRAVSAQNEGHRLFELREWGPSFEQEVEDTAFQAAEGFWMGRSLDWMVYVSHEASVTFAGQQLIEAMSQLPGFSAHLYPPVQSLSEP